MVLKLNVTGLTIIKIQERLREHFVLTKIPRAEKQTKTPHMENMQT